MTLVLGVGGGTPGSGVIAGQDDVSFQEAGDLVDVAANWYSPADAGMATGATARSGNFTTGGQFQISRALSCTGVRFYWQSVGGARTVRCKVWQGGVALASVDIAVNASGVYTGTFAAPVSPDPYEFFYATVWETTGANYIDAKVAGSIIDDLPINPFCYAQLLTVFSNVAGDHIPNNSSPNELYPVEPVFASFSLG